MTTSTKIKTIIAADFWAGGLFNQAEFRRLQYASVNDGVMRRAKYPEHLTFVKFHQSVCSLSGILRFVSKIKDSIFFTIRHFANFWQVGMFSINAVGQTVSSVFFKSFLDRVLKPFWICFFEVGRLFISSFVNTFIGTIFTNRTAIFRADKFFTAYSTNNRRISPIRDDVFTLPLGFITTRQSAISLRIIFRCKRLITSFAISCNH